MLARSGIARRQTLVDTGSGGTIKVYPQDLSVLLITTAGTRTLQDATTIPLGNSVLVCSTAASAVVSASGTTYTLNAGEYAEFIVNANSSNVNVWGLRRSSRNAAATVSRAIPLTHWRQDAALQSLPPVAGLNDTQLTISNGTYGTTAPDLQARANSLGPVTIAGRCVFELPANYSPGTNITLTAAVTRTTAATLNGTLQFNAFEQAAPSTQLIADAATNINAAGTTTVTNTITGTSLVSGSVLDLRAIVATNGNGTTAGEYHITKVSITYQKSV